MSDPHLIDKISGMIPENHFKRAKTGYRELWHPLSQLLDQRKIPEKGWSDRQIKQLILFLNSLDSDKDPGAIRIGEREGRLSTPYLSDLSAGFAHGVGRSGELTAPQPKAAGASLMQNLTNKVVLSLLRDVGLPNIKGALTVPFGTGMSLGMALRGALTTRAKRSCSTLVAGCTPSVTRGRGGCPTLAGSRSGYLDPPTGCWWPT